MGAENINHSHVTFVDIPREHEHHRIVTTAPPVFPFNLVFHPEFHTRAFQLDT